MAQCNSCPSTHRSCWTCGRVPCALLRQGGVLTFQCHRKSVEWVPSERAASAPCTGHCHPGRWLLLPHHCCWTHHRGHSALSSRLPSRHSHGMASKPPRCCASVAPVHCPGWGHPMGREFREKMYLAFSPRVGAVDASESEKLSDSYVLMRKDLKEIWSSYKSEHQL